MKNYHRFYASFQKLPKCGTDEDAKAALVSQWTGGRTTHLHEMRAREYDDCCKAMESMLGYGDRRKRHRSICLHLMQELGIDTKDWQRINDFCSHPRICGKVFALLDIPGLETLELKLRAIKRRGGLWRREQERAEGEEPKAPVNNIIIIQQNGNNNDNNYNPAGGIRPS